jgi:hypothetical protein
MAAAHRTTEGLRQMVVPATEIGIEVLVLVGAVDVVANQEADDPGSHPAAFQPPIGHGTGRRRGDPLRRQGYDPTLG